MAEIEMQYRPLGRCGTRVSVYGLGGWLTFGASIEDADNANAIIKHAFDAGINFFDSADIYARGACERAMGQMLKQYPRHELVVSTKVFFPMSEDTNDRGLSRKHIVESIDRSLKNLGMDYVDVYFCHRFDPDTPVEETARAMDDLVHQGKVLYWGTSEWSAEQLQDAYSVCRAANLYGPQVEQPQFSLLKRKRFEKEVGPPAQSLGMGTVVWSPLGMGLLTGKYDQGMPSDSRMAHEEWLHEGLYTDQNIDRVRRFKTIAENAGYSRTQLALAWARSHPAVSSVILGATRLEQLQENLNSLAVSLSDEVRSQLNDLFV